MSNSSSVYWRPPKTPAQMKFCTSPGAGAPSEVTLAVTRSDTPSAVAVSAAEPGESAFSRPPAPTVATKTSSLDQVTVGVTTSPSASRTTADSVTLSPSTSEGAPGVTSTVTATRGPTVTVAVSLLPSLVAITSA